MSDQSYTHWIGYGTLQAWAAGAGRGAVCYVDKFSTVLGGFEAERVLAVRVARFDGPFVHLAQMVTGRQFVIGGIALDTAANNYGVEVSAALFQWLVSTLGARGFDVRTMGGPLVPNGLVMRECELPVDLGWEQPAASSRPRGVGTTAGG